MTARATATLLLFDRPSAGGRAGSPLPSRPRLRYAPA